MVGVAVIYFDHKTLYTVHNILKKNTQNRTQIEQCKAYVFEDNIQKHKNCLKM